MGREPLLTSSGICKRTIVLLGECLLAGADDAVVGGHYRQRLLPLCYAHAGSMAEGFGLAIGAGVVGGAVRYFKTTRRVLSKLTAGKLFQ